MPCRCQGTHRAPQAVTPNKVPGEQGFLRMGTLAQPPYDVWGEVTNVKYPFANKGTLFVDTRDAMYLLGEEFILVQI